MIAQLVNLSCGNGHRHYAPPREWAEWVGKDCLHGAWMTKSGASRPGRCRRTLVPIKAPRGVAG